MEGTKDGPMESDSERNEELGKLRRREAELIERIERLKTSMSRTSEISTLVFKNNLMKEAQDELRRVQEKLSEFTNK
jgi:hypothetical protein